MRIAILSRNESLYSTRALAEAGRKRGHDVQVLDTLQFDIRVSKRSPELFYQGKPVGPIDAVIPRIGASITFYGLAVVRQFEMMGVYCVNESQAIARSRDKLRCLQILSRHDIGMPPTVYTRQAAHLLNCIEHVEGPPVVIKLLQGTQGIGVVLAETTAAASSVIEAFQGLEQNILIQKFIKEANGADIRALVVGRKVVAAMKRQALAGEFRSNLHRGGTAKKFRLPAEYRKTALAAARVLGLRVAGVDMIESAEGPMVMEVNSSPGLEGVQKATGADVADAIIEHIERELPAAMNGAATSREQERHRTSGTASQRGNKRMSAPTATRLMTTEEFLALPDDGIDRDLINGVVREWGVRMTRRNRVHSRVETRIAHLLESWLEKQPQPRGAVHSGEAGCVLARNPDVTVGIDVAYISPELAAQPSDETTMIDGVPTLAVEILSPSTKEEEVNDKLDAYRTAGVPLVWLVDPHLRTVMVLRPDADPVLFNVNQELTAEPHLPGFRVRVADFFVR